MNEEQVSDALYQSHKKTVIEHPKVLRLFPASVDSQSISLNEGGAYST